MRGDSAKEDATRVLLKSMSCLSRGNVVTAFVSRVRGQECHTSAAMTPYLLLAGPSVDLVAGPGRAEVRAGRAVMEQPAVQLVLVSLWMSVCLTFAE